jgi:acyl transferase domain-containing protein
MLPYHCVGCRWAGGVKDSPSLWELLRNKQDGWREFSEPRFPAEGFYHPNQDRPGSVRQRGGFLCDEDPRLFDHAFFNMMGREVETMDPNQRKLLEVGQ